MNDLDRGASRDVRALMTRTLVGQGLRVLRSVVVLPLIPPAGLGLYRLVTVTMSYLALLHLGVFGTVSVRYPQSEAAGDTETCTSYQRLAWQLAAIGSVISFVALIVLLVTSDFAERWLVVAIAALGATQLLSKYIDVMYTLTRQFGAAAMNDLVSALIGFVVAVAGTYWLGVAGLLLGTVVTPLVSVAMGAKLLFPPGWLRIDRPFWRQQIPEAVRLWLSSLAIEASYSIDILILGAVLGVHDSRLGLYAFGTVIASLTGLATTSLVRVQVVHLSRTAGSVGDIRDEAVAVQMEKALLRDAVATVWSACGISVAVGVLVPWLLPRYAPSLPFLGLFLAAAVVMRWSKYPRHMLVMASRNRWVTVAAALAVLYTGLHIAAVHWLLDDDLIAYAACSEIAYLISTMLIIASAYRVLSYGGAARFCGRLLVAHAPLMLFNLQWLWPSELTAVIGAIVFVSTLVTFRVVFPGTITDTRVLLLDGFLRRRQREPETE